LPGAALPDLNTLLGQQGSLRSQLAALPGQLGITSLQQYKQALSVSDLAGSPEDRLGSARSIYDTTLARARTGDLSAIGQFPQVAQQLLGVGRDVYASGPGFAELFTSVNQALNEILDHQRSVQEDLLKDLPTAIEQSGKDQIEAIKNQTKQIIDALKDLQTSVDRVRAATAG
jgi:hypothetical protein